MEKKNYGSIKVGVGTTLEHSIEIADFAQAKFKDNRLVSMSKLVDESYVIAVENPASSGRNTQSTIWLTKESVIAMLTTCILYFNIKKENLDELLKNSLQGEMIDYSLSDNLKPLNPNHAKD